MVQPLMRTLTVTKADLIKLEGVDYMTHQFKAQIFLKFNIRGGASDAALASESKEFPFGPDGKPTFRPSAAWYLEQFEMSNAIKVDVLDKKAFVEGEDVVVQIRYDGVFRETMELYDFPFDTQGCSMALSCNTRSTGMMPAEFSLGDDPTTAWTLGSIDMGGWSQGSLYNLRPTMLMRCHMVGSDADRMFPTITITPLIQRRALFQVLNCMVPFALFALLSGLQFAALPIRDGKIDQAGNINHRAQLSLMMVLTYSAYKMAVGSRLPAVAYLTLVDKYMLSIGCYVVGVAIYLRIVSWVASGGDVDFIEKMDRAAAMLFGCFYVALHVGFVLWAHALHRMGAPQEDELIEIVRKEKAYHKMVHHHPDKAYHPATAAQSAPVHAASSV